MKLSQENQTKYQIVTLLFSLLLGVGVALLMLFVVYVAIEIIINLSLLAAVFSWLSIRLAFAQWKDSHWILLAMRMVLYFCGMITVLLMIWMWSPLLYEEHFELYPAVIMTIIWIPAAVFLLAIVLMIPFSFLSHWLSRLSSTESQENQLKDN